MKLFDKRWKKILWIISGVVVGLVILIIAFISPIAKYLIEKYDEQILGRQITINWMYVNPFTGYSHINGLKLYEQNKDSIFVSAQSADVNFSMLKLLGKTYEISDVTLNKPVFHLIQNHQQFNFSDLITRFAPKDTLNRDTTPVKFSILNIHINDGTFYYDELSIPVHYFVKELNISSPGKWWNKDSVEYKISLVNGPGPGKLSASGSINLKTLDYRVKALVEKFDLKIFEQYLRDFANYGSLAANLDADINTSGNFNDELNLRMSGFVGVNDFHFGKIEGDDFASFAKVGLNIKYMNPKEYEYIFDTIGIIKPFFKYERYDELDNLQRMFGVNGENYKAAKADSSKFNLIIAIADFVKVLGKNFVKSHYKANQLAVRDADFGFNDYALREKFAVAATPLNLISKDIDRNNKNISVALETDVKPHGKIKVDFDANPKDFSHFDLKYDITELAVPDLNPYTITYTSFPFKSGTIQFHGDWDVDGSMIESTNHLIIINPQLTKRIRKKDAKWLPVPLILAFVKEPGNYIDYVIPVKGDLQNPRFILKDVIGDIVRNIFVKPPTSPYRAYVKSLQNEVEKYQIFRWEMHQYSVNNQEQHFLRKLADFLHSNPEAKVYVQPVIYKAKEKEHMLLYEAKKKFYMHSCGKNETAFTEKDSMAIEKMSVKDSLFIRALDASVDSSALLFTVQEKCMRYVDTNMVNNHVAHLEDMRRKTFLSPFKDEGVIKRIVFAPEKADYPRGGFSYYKISYDGDIPEKLRNALENLDENVAKVLTFSERRELKKESR